MKHQAWCSHKLFRKKGKPMLEFPPQDKIEVFANEQGLICFRSAGDIENTEEQIVCLTIGQFRSVMKNSQDLIARADEFKRGLT